MLHQGLSELCVVKKNMTYVQYGATCALIVPEAQAALLTITFTP